MGKDRVQRIWRREGLKVPAKQKPRGRLWLNDGSCIRLRPERPNHVWSYDFVEARTHDGRSLRLLTMIDEYTRQCLAIRVARRLNSYHVIETLGDCMLEHGVPEHVRYLPRQPAGEVIHGASLLDIGEALTTAALYVGNDTGLSHLAAAVGVPCVVIFPHSGRPDIWLPRGKNRVNCATWEFADVRSNCESILSSCCALNRASG